MLSRYGLRTERLWRSAVGKKEYARQFCARSKESAAEKKRDYNELEKDWKREYNSKYSALKRDEIKQYFREYNEKNKDSKRLYDRQYRMRNKNRLKEAKRAYVGRNRDSIEKYRREYTARNENEMQEYFRDYHLRNRDVIKNYSREYNQRNKADIRETKRKYNSRNQDSRKEYTRGYYIRNKVDIDEYLRRYYLSNKDDIKESIRDKYIRNLENPILYSPRNIALKSWRTPELVREYFDSIAVILGIEDHTDWYRISRPQIASLGGVTLYSKFQSLGGALQHAYPEVNWEFDKFSHRGKKSGQRWLRVMVESLLPGVEIMEEYRHPDLTWDDTSREIEMDLWIPQYNIGIEYQGEHHFFSMDNAFGPNGTSTLYSERDLVKLSLCQTRGITLFIIPYWWDGGISSLSATLYQGRSDVFPKSNGTPIPRELLSKVNGEETNVKFVNRNMDSNSFICEQENGVVCTVRVSGADYANAPSTGCVLRVRYNGLSSKSGKLKYPVLLGISSMLE